MPTATKAKSIEQAKDWYEKALGVVFTDYRSLNVKEMQGLRKTLRAKGGEIHVIKNTLFRIAAGSELVDSLPEEYHNGTTAFAFVYENEPDVAKALVDFSKSSKKLAIKGGVFGGKALSAKEVEALSELPPRDVLVAQLIGTIAAPLTNLVGLVEAIYAEPVRTIAAVADKAAEGSPAAAPAEVKAVEAEPAPSSTEAPASEPISEVTAEPAAESTETAEESGTPTGE